MTDDIEAPPSLVDDFLSGESSRVLHALWAVVASRDPDVLGPVATALPTVEDATADADLGGALMSNNRNLEHAFDRIRLFARGACLCAAYPAHSAAYDPAKEKRRGHVRIVGTVPNERQWEPDRICECTDCGKRFQVEQGEYHYTWWKWTELLQSTNSVN